MASQEAVPTPFWDLGTLELLPNFLDPCKATVMFPTGFIGTEVRQAGLLGTKSTVHKHKYL